ncbi:hypothetical protein [Microvirga zambiensis]|uniref:hypothetical protein n=1 Tax=Microvirga zambiensis TaxID=1402137 RepID=UPI00191F996C|nr:hypothetical protein [Microvirga zambiensis]
MFAILARHLSMLADDIPLFAQPFLCPGPALQAPELHHCRLYELEEDRLVVKPQRIANHEYRGKVVPSGFFNQPKAENVSAVLFSTAGVGA